ncbi:MAG: IS630 family transposase, partial [Candidatus Zixiibacteriota bacterium]
ERFFRDLDEKRVRRGVFRSVPQLIDAVMSYIAQHNSDPKPFVWRKTVEEIIDKVGRARLALDNAPTE